MSKIIEGNRELPDSYWWQFMFDTYAVTQAVAVRRQADLHKDVASLGVVPGDVANAGLGWAVAERCVGAALVVVVDPVWQGLLAGCR